jgi:hypothetical protein
MIPYVLDDLTLSEVARGDADLIRLLLSYDASGQALIVPVLAAVAADRQSPPPMPPTACAGSSTWTTL